ncbi:TetR/AcrR family transcriptional regulator [Streptomyces cinereoruber]|uniref:TetR/AcrR family transcriptional regulator n=1 Tax=Streptomyces TaxID=1883 RepID=UPI0036305730
MDKGTKTRERILDVFEEIILIEGERAATVDGTAAKAGISKGGLRYHFESKASMVDGLVDRVERQLAGDHADILSAPEGAVEYFLRASADPDNALEQSSAALLRLYQSGRYPQAHRVLDQVVATWLDALTERLGDPLIARLVQLVRDGIFYNSTIAKGSGGIARATLEAHELNDLITLLHSLKAKTSPR